MSGVLGKVVIDYLNLTSFVDKYMKTIYMYKNALSPGWGTHLIIESPLSSSDVK